MTAAKRQELEARTAEAVEFAGQVARQLDGCRERANAAEVEISRLKATLDFIATDATITPEGCPEPWRSTLIEWAQAANHALRTACTCDPEAYEVGPEGQRRYFEDRGCPVHGEPFRAVMDDLAERRTRDEA